MADVTFGVKVPEEMKNELSELMKESTVSGKEFMEMLIASYKLEKTKGENSLFDGDLKELQGHIKRIQSIFMNMMEKSSMEIMSQQKECEKKINEGIEVQDKLKNLIEEQKQILKDEQDKLKATDMELEKAKKQAKDLQEEVNTYKQQMKNQVLLHTKFEEEVNQLHQELERYKRLDIEIAERNEECSKLKNRNDELASEIWFLKREIEKNAQDKEQLSQKYEKDMSQIKVQHALELKNELLEQRLKANEEISQLKDEINHLKEELLKMISETNRDNKSI